MEKKDIRDQIKKTYSSIAKEFSISRKDRHHQEFDYFLKWIPKGVKLLDLGCGDGRLLSYLEKKQKHVDYTGIDFCPELLALAKKQYPKATFIEQDIAELSLPDQFDRIISVAAFHHLPTRALRKKALKKIFEHLSDRGLFILSVWNLWQFRYWRSWLKSFFSRDLFIPFGQKKVPRYYHAFVPFELKSLIREAGFSLEESISHEHNFFFVCSKKVAVTPMNPLLIPDHIEQSPA